MGTLQQRRKTEAEFPTHCTKMPAAEQSLMKQMCPILVSTSVFGEVALQMTLSDEVTRRFDLKVASNFMTAETVFHSKLSL